MQDVWAAEAEREYTLDYPREVLLWHDNECVACFFFFFFFLIDQSSPFLPILLSPNATLSK